MDREQRESKQWYDKLFTFNLTNFPSTLGLKMYCSKRFKYFPFVSWFFFSVFVSTCKKLTHYTAKHRLYDPQETVHSLQDTFYDRVAVDVELFSFSRVHSNCSDVYVISFAWEAKATCSLHSSHRKFHEWCWISLS